jgi:hypothetical protein
MPPDPDAPDKVRPITVELGCRVSSGLEAVDAITVTVALPPLEATVTHDGRSIGSSERVPGCTCIR